MTSGVRGGARLAVVFILGFFALAAQSLLFREFFSVFEGNELGFGCFFSSWLLWVGAGALAARRLTHAVRKLTGLFEWLPLLYLPAFILQLHLVQHARVLAGVQPFELFPLARMFPVAMLANAPVSFVTGLLFTTACAWLSGAGGLPPARVYFFEALGGGAGGVAVTAALAAGWPAETIFMVAALLPAAALLFCRRRVALVLVLLLLAALGLRLDRIWQQHRDRAAWARMLPAESFRGRFVTPQAAYLYGEYQGQFVVRSWESVVESIPDDEHAGEVAGLALAQAPAARRLLIIGGGYSLCERFLGLPQVESVTWLHPDPEYPSRLLAVLPKGRRSNESRWRVPRLDPRRYLREPGPAHDLIILNLPDATTLSLNRYFTAGFYRLLRERLDPVRGVVAVRFSGGENYLGGELVNLGASLLVTLESVFQKQVLQPGGESWLFASVKAPLTDVPGDARDRFAAIPGAEDVCPPDRLLSAFPPDRVEFQLSAYREAAARAPDGWLLNTDAHPKALLYALLLVGLQGGVAREVAAAVRQLSLMGPWVLFLPLLLYGALRFIYRRRSVTVPVEDGPGGVFDAGFLVFSAGLAGMSFSLVLMFLYQSAFGSIYLQIGLLTSLFMLGLFVGGLAVERLLTRLAREPAWLLAVAIALHVGLMAAVFAAADRIDRPVFAALFFLAGILGGVYVPVAVFRLKQAGRDDPSAGGAVEWLDTLGGAAGGLMAGLLLLPLLGLAASLIFPALALAVNLPSHFLGARAAGTGDAVDHWARRAGYVLFGLSVFVLLASRAADQARPSESGERLRAAAEQLAPGLAFKVEHATRSDGPAVTYLVLEDGGYLFTTDQLAPDISGYGGPITLAVLIGREGDLRKARILRANETPQYQRKAATWLDTLQGRNLFDLGSLSGVDGASGATFTSRAIVETLRASGCLFSQEVLRRAPVGESLPARAFPFEKEAAYFLLFAVVALVLRRRPSVWRRRAFLLAVVFLLGWRWNMQYSAAHVLGVMAGAWPAAGLTLAFVLTAGVPALAAVFGNFYCGYLCPFGALQELVGELRPRSWTLDPDKPAWRFARWLKYGLLFALLMGYALTRNAGLADLDPLNTIFSPLRSPLVLALGVTGLALSVAYRRFWCRNFCPAGAFLALVNGLKLTVRWLPGIKSGRCDYGVRHARELDCLLCDRCRMNVPPRPAPFPVARSALFYAMLAGCVIFFAPRLRPEASVTSAPDASHAATVQTSRARQVDMRRLRDLLDRGRLSTNEALYYRRLPEDSIQE